MDASVPSPRISRFEPVPRTPDRVRVHLDDDSVVEAPREAVLDASLSTGDPVDARLRAELEDADLRSRVREAALGLLSHRPRSRSELARRLRRKDFPDRVVVRCLDELEEEELVDDAAFARAWVRDRLRLKPRARAALLAELRGKGVKGPVADDAVEEVFQKKGVREEELVVDVALGWLRRQSPRIREGLTAERFSDAREKARRRLVGYLRRRGFRGGTVHRGLEAVEAEVETS